MVTTVTLNPCVDLTVRLDTLEPGALNRAREVGDSFGGKGVNVATTLHTLGVPCCCTGIAFQDRGDELEDLLNTGGIQADFVHAPGRFRTNIKVMEENGRMTELNSPGPKVSSPLLQEAEDRVATLAEVSDILVLSGRLPSGASDDTYRRILRRVKHLPVRVVVDTEGPALMEAIKERPYLIKPNLQELCDTFGVTVGTTGEILGMCGRILSLGVQVVCVSLGKGGAVIADRSGQAWKAEAVPVTVHTLHGAGDAMVAGLCKAAAEGRGLSGLLQSGIAAAGASVLRTDSTPLLLEDYQRLLADVSPRQLT